MPQHPYNVRAKPASRLGTTKAPATSATFPGNHSVEQYTHTNPTNFTHTQITLCVRGFVGGPCRSQGGEKSRSGRCAHGTYTSERVLGRGAHPTLMYRYANVSTDAIAT